jgi:endonuclease YncB( thermonuclease family)
VSVSGRRVPADAACVLAQVRNRDQYGRGVASCSLPGPGGDLGAWLVRSGLAVAYRRAAGFFNLP